MKKKFFVLVMTMAALVMCSRPSANVEIANAAENHYTVEYAQSGVTLPLLHLQEGESYQVEVFNAEDTNYSTPLAKKSAYVFVADKMGDYLLRYRVNRNGIETYEYASLTIQDTVAPIITLNHKETYTVGETVVLRPQIEDDTASMSKVTYQLIGNGKPMSSAIKDGVITFAEAGEYKLQISVTDGGGNMTKSLYTFVVNERQLEPDSNLPQGSASDSKSGCSAALPFGIGGATAVAMMGVMLLKKKKENE